MPSPPPLDEQQREQRGKQPAAALLAELEQYYDLVPRVAARVEQVGTFTLFVSTGLWPYYARPTLGLERSVSLADVLDVLVRQRELGLPQSLEWVAETTPSLAPAARAAGLTVLEAPLMVLARPPILVPAPPGVAVRVLDAADPAVGAARVVQDLAFASPGTAQGDVGPAERDAALATRDAAADTFVRGLIDSGALVTAVAEDARHGVLAAGNHTPRGRTTEVVGVATLPSARRHGLAAAVTSTLVEDALGHGGRTVFLSAGDEDVARVYERVGFRRAGTACIATAPPPR